MARQPRKKNAWRGVNTLPLLSIQFTGFTKSDSREAYRHDRRSEKHTEHTNERENTQK